MTVEMLPNRSIGRAISSQIVRRSVEAVHSAGQPTLCLKTAAKYTERIGRLSTAFSRRRLRRLESVHTGRPPSAASADRIPQPPPCASRSPAGTGSLPSAHLEELLPLTQRRRRAHRSQRILPGAALQPLAPHTPVRRMPSVQKARTSGAQSAPYRRSPLSVASTPDLVRAMTAPRMSTGAPRLSSQAATSTKSSPARSTTVLSMCAPVSNMNRRPTSPGPAAICPWSGVSSSARPLR